LSVTTILALPSFLVSCFSSFLSAVSSALFVAGVSTGFSESLPVGLASGSSVLGFCDPAVASFFSEESGLGSEGGRADFR